MVRLHLLQFLAMLSPPLFESQETVSTSDDGKVVKTIIEKTTREVYETESSELCHDFGDPKSTRKALLIANEQFTLNRKLRNPVGDAVLFQDTLVKSGFAGRSCKNLDDQMIAHEVANYTSSLGPQDVSMTVLTGHGYESEGENFLLGSNDVGFPLKSLLTKLEAREDRALNIVVLDACRTDPSKKSISQRGFSAVAAARGVYVAFASAAGKPSYDWYETLGNPNPSEHSPFAFAFAEAVEKYPGLDIDLMFRKVRERVMELTQDDQIPWSTHGITGTFEFMPASATAPTG